MRYELPYNSDKQLSPHINAQELKCKCGGCHNITVDTELIDKAESLISNVAITQGADEKDVHINISSANRCKQHDINVGGSGWGMHVVGKAIDFQLTYKGNAIDSRLIACVAQEIGFNGIGRIPSVGDYIHCDVGTLAEHGGIKWLGDETAKGGTSGSVIYEPNTYWNYYGLDRNEYFKGDTSIEDNDTPEVKLQKILNDKGSSLDTDGIIGTLTLTELRNYTIEPNDSGELTKWVQEKLKSLGYDIDVNGTADEKTMNVIHEFQKKNGLGIGKNLSGGDWAILMKGEV